MRERNQPADPLPGWVHHRIGRAHALDQRLGHPRSSPVAHEPSSRSPPMPSTKFGVCSLTQPATQT
jgi:hypothetical protein